MAGIDLGRVKGGVQRACKDVHSDVVHAGAPDGGRGVGACEAPRIDA